MRLFRGLVLALVMLPLPLAAQDRGQTLADIRAELGALGAELGALRQELVTTGAVSQTGGATMLDRIDAIEGELARLTARTEELEFRIDRVVADGTNRLGDLEFRLVELEGGDVSGLGSTPALGGQAAGQGGGNAQTQQQAAVPAAPTPQAVAGEQAQFDRAREVLGQGDFRSAADLFAAHAQTWAQGPLTGEALFLRGEALDQLGETSNAARAYLDSFSGYPDGPRAAEALFRLGRALGRLGQVYEACLTLAEVGVRYPASPAVAEAAAERAALSCQ